MSGLKKKIQKAQAKAKKIVKEIKKAEQFANAPMRTTGRAIGGKLGNRKAGDAIGGILGRVFGTGDYYVKSNSLAVHGIATDSAPTFTRAGRGMRVTHREFLGTVVAHATAGQFKNTSYLLNPGNPVAFPWLSNIAANFDQWQPNGIVVTYKNMSSSYSGTASLGTVVIASDYDVFDDIYSNKIEMENSEFCVSANCATDILHPVECNLNERFTRVLNVRDGSIPSGDNKRFYDLCNLQVATQGATANQFCGELWISYDITFYKEQIPKSLVDRSYTMFLASNVNYTPSTSMLYLTNSQLITTLPNGDSYNGDYLTALNAWGSGTDWLHVISTSTANMCFYFPVLSAGTIFMIRVWINGATNTNVGPTPFYVNCTSQSDVLDATNTEFSQSGSSAGQLVEWTTRCMDQLNSPASLNLASWTSPGGPRSIRVLVYQISNNLVGFQ